MVVGAGVAGGERGTAQRPHSPPAGDSIAGPKSDPHAGAVLGRSDILCDGGGERARARAHARASRFHQSVARDGLTCVGRPASGFCLGDAGAHLESSVL